jgi:hypothetical protein
MCVLLQRPRDVKVVLIARGAQGTGAYSSNNDKCNEIQQAKQKKRKGKLRRHAHMHVSECTQQQPTPLSSALDARRSLRFLHVTS